MQGLPVQQETCDGRVPAAGRPDSGPESQAGGSEASSERETGPAGLQGSSLCSESGHGYCLTFIQHEQRMFSLTAAFPPLSLISS